MNKTIIAYQQGGQWVINDNGYIRSLPWYVKTRQQVRTHVAQMQKLADPDIKLKIKWS